MNLNKYIDHTLLKPDATKAQILQLCEEAKKYNFMTCMVNPSWIPTVKEALKGSDVLSACVIGFPLGAMTCATKVFETKNALEMGADEIKAVKEACGNRLLKVIIETCLLTDEEKKRATQDVILGGADFVKTSTGFSTHGATVEDVKILKAAAGDAIQVKAAGGVRSKDDLYAMIEAGAQRIGTSSGVKLMEE